MRLNFLLRNKLSFDGGDFHGAPEVLYLFYKASKKYDLMT